MGGVSAPPEIRGSRLTLLLQAVQVGAEAVEFLDGLGSIQIHQFNAMAHLDPADAAFRHEKPDSMTILEVNHQRSPLGAVATEVTGGQDPGAPEALGQGLQAHHQVRHHVSVLRGQS